MLDFLLHSRCFRLGMGIQNEVLYSGRTCSLEKNSVPIATRCRNGRHTSALKELRGWQFSSCSSQLQTFFHASGCSSAGSSHHSHDHPTIGPMVNDSRSRVGPSHPKTNFHLVSLDHSPKNTLADSSLNKLKNEVVVTST